MTLGPYRFEGPWGQCASFLLMALFTVWYLQDAYTASPTLPNMILIGPIGAVALIICASFLARELRGLRIVPAGPRDPVAERDYRVAGAMALMVLYIVGLFWIGFDIATFLFLAGGMALQGERRWAFLIIYAAIVSATVVYGMRELLSVPVPTLFL
ncbi:tripartite tricarboxylate transporter TctB family protein (plasmid) [Skermanella mucosa]|uniref:tripartite tricarboxylate transporter TctB family protein n=1 Tax=Skermanella mucosa TaxID=1789672 RepID=UPI00192B11E0|nr:tripartite tricarboxylate transporter TctB family protein [Skermanella mucosa]UEM24420.1 tripartite tricarboxylate transporter TctB family protein [Skermanella mucosa]